MADIDGDGDLDGTCCGGGGPTPVVNSTPSTFHFALNDGTGAFAPAFLVDGIGGKRFAGAVDVDGDGDRDMVAGRSILFNDGTFAADPEPACAPPIVYGNARVGDIDGDGDPDVIAPSTGAAVGPVLRNDGGGSLTAAAPQLPPAPAGTLFTGPGYWGDFDGDGDVIVGHTQGSTLLGMRLLENRAGKFVDAGLAGPAGVNFSRTASLTHFGGLSLSADLDGDGDVDIAVGHDTGLIVIQVWRNDGTGHFGAGAMFFAGIPVHAADMDGDGHADIVTAFSSSSVAVQFGVGDGTFPTATSWTAAVHPVRDRLAVGDFNGDGLLDLANADGTLHDVRVWFQQPGRTFVATSLSAPVPYSTSLIYHADAVDLDGNGTMDLVAGPTVEAGDAASFVFLGDGVGGFAAPIVQVVAPRAFADVDGDGDLDAVGNRVVRNSTWNVPLDGIRSQYGAGAAGLDGFVPQLGASGPFRVGEPDSVHLRGGIGGTVALLMLGQTRAQYVDLLPGVTFLVDQLVRSDLYVLGGDVGLPGAGTLDFDFIVPAGARGVTLHWQALLLDPTRPGSINYSNGLTTGWGVR